MLTLARRLAREQAFDLVQSQDPVFTGSVGDRLSRAFRLPHNVCVYGANPFDAHWVTESVWTRVAAPIGRRVLRRADGAQVDGSRTRRSLIEAGLADARVAIKPMVPQDLETFFEAVPDASLREELTAGGRFDRLALFVGRLAPQKDVPLLLDAVAGLRARHPGLRVVCIGEGPERRRLEEHAHPCRARRGLAGRPSPSDVARVMAACDVLVLPSRYEGFARVLMEAAAAGLPIVTADVSGADDAVRDGDTGRIVPVGDTAALSAAIAELMADPERARDMGRRGRSRMREVAARHASPRRQIEIWEDLVRRLPRFQKRAVERATGASTTGANR